MKFPVFLFYQKFPPHRTDRIGQSAPNRPHRTERTGRTAPPRFARRCYLSEQNGALLASRAYFCVLSFPIICCGLASLAWDVLDFVSVSLLLWSLFGLLVWRSAAPPAASHCSAAVGSIVFVWRRGGSFVAGHRPSSFRRRSSASRSLFLVSFVASVLFLCPSLLLSA